MTYDEFVEKLTWYFSRRDIEELDRTAYNEAKTAFDGEDYSVSELYEMGRAFICDQISDTPGHNPDEFRENLKGTVGIKMTYPNAAALLADLESGAF